MNKRTLKFVTLLLSCLLLIGAAVGITAAANGTDPSVKIVNKNVAYEGAVELVFALKTENAGDYTAKVVFTDGAVDVAAGQNVSATAGYVKNTNGSITNNGTEYPLVYSNGIVAKMLRKEVVATPVLVDGEGVIAYVGESVTYSPYIYCMNRFTNATNSAEQVELYKALLDYSAAVQTVLLSQDGGDINTYGGWADAYYVYSIDGAAKEGRGIDGAPVLEADRLNAAKAFAGFFEDGAQVYEYGEGNTSSAWYKYTVRPGYSGNFTLSYIDRGNQYVDSLAAGNLYPGSSVGNHVTLAKPETEKAQGVYAYIDSEDGNYFWTLEKTHSANPHTISLDVTDVNNCAKDFSVEFDIRWNYAENIRDNQPFHIYFYSFNKDGTNVDASSYLPAGYAHTAINDGQGVKLYGNDMNSGEWHTVRYEISKFVNADGVVCVALNVYVDGKLAQTIDKATNGKAIPAGYKFRIYIDNRYEYNTGHYTDMNIDLDNIHVDYSAATTDTHVYGENVSKDTLKTAATATTRAAYYLSCNVCGKLSEDTFEYGQYDKLAVGTVWNDFTGFDVKDKSYAGNDGAYSYIEQDADGNYFLRYNRVNTTTSKVANIAHNGKVDGATEYVYEFDFRWVSASTTSNLSRAFIGAPSTSSTKTGGSSSGHYPYYWVQLNSVFSDGTTADGVTTYSTFKYNNNTALTQNKWYNIRYEYKLNGTNANGQALIACKIYIDDVEIWSKTDFYDDGEAPRIRFEMAGSYVAQNMVFDIDNYSFTTDGHVHGGVAEEIPTSSAIASAATATAPATYYKSYSCCGAIAFDEPTFEYGSPDVLQKNELWDNIIVDKFLEAPHTSGAASYICVDEDGNYVLRSEHINSDSSNNIKFQYASAADLVSKYVYEFDLRYNGVAEGETASRLFLIDINDTPHMINDTSKPNHTYQKHWFQDEAQVRYNADGSSYLCYGVNNIGYNAEIGTWFNVRYEFIVKYAEDGTVSGYTCNAYINNTFKKSYEMVVGTEVPHVYFHDMWGTRPKNSSYDIDNYNAYVETIFDTENTLTAEIESVYNGADAMVTLVTDLDTNYWEVPTYVDELLRKYGLTANLATVTKNLYADNSYKNFNGIAVKAYQDFLNTGRWQITNHSIDHKSYVSVDDNGKAYVDEEKLANYILSSGELIRAAFPTQKVLTYAMTGSSANAITVNGETLSVSRDAEYALIGDNYIISRGWGSERDIGELVWNDISTWDLRMGDNADSISRNSAELAALIENGQYAVIYNHYLYKVNDYEKDGYKDHSSYVRYDIVDALYGEIAQYVAEGKLWCANFEDAGKYLREAATATVKAIEYNGTVLVKLTDEMDDSIYDHELSITITLPEALSAAPAVKVTQGDKVSYYAVADGKVLINMIPDVAMAVIEAEADASNVVAKPEYDADSAPATPVINTETPAIPDVYTAEDPSNFSSTIKVSGGVYPFSTEKIAIVEDAVKGLVYKLTKGSTTATYVHTNGNVVNYADKFVAEIDVKIDSAAELYIGLKNASGTNVCHAYFYVSNSNLYVFDSCTKQSVGGVIPARNTWFTLKFEYTKNEDGTGSTVISVNGTPAMTATTTSASAPAVGSVNTLFFNGGNGLVGDVYFDNIKLYHEGVVEAEPTDYYTADDETLAGIRFEDNDLGSETTFITTTEDSEKGKVYWYKDNSPETYGYAQFTANEVVEGADKFIFEADMKVNPESNGNEFYIAFNDSNGVTLLDSWMIVGNCYQITGVPRMTGIANSGNQWFNIKIEIENNKVTCTIGTDSEVFTADLSSALSVAAIQRVQIRGGGGFVGDIYLDNVKVYQAKTN